MIDPAVHIQPIPEPSTFYAMMAGGLFFVVWAFIKRRKK